MLSKIDILGSSSDGNAYVLTFDSGLKFQFDAGKKNIHPEQIECCCISHSHIDHNKFEKDFKHEQLGKGGLCTMIDCPEKGYQIDCTHVPHEVETGSFRLTHDGERILYITDCSDPHYIGDFDDIEDYDPTVLMIECNWDEFLINQGLLKKESYSDYALKNHMSNFQCLELIRMLHINKDCKIIFLHKSKHHATYENTYKMFDSLPNKKYVAKEGETLYVKSGKSI